MRTTILTVLREGGEYTTDHVRRLRDQCAIHAPDVEFVCLSDDLVHDWPGWWAKIEAFRIPGPVLYMDLDTTLTADLRPLLDVAGKHEFVALRDFNPHMREMGSGLMAWSGDMSRVYDRFSQDPDRHMAAYTSPRWFGDQGFVERQTGGREYWQDLLPGAVVSWKKHCAAGVPDGARVVCFHGKPRPWDVAQ